MTLDHSPSQKQEMQGELDLLSRLNVCIALFCAEHRRLVWCNQSFVDGTIFSGKAGAQGPTDTFTLNELFRTESASTVEQLVQHALAHRNAFDPEISVLKRRNRGYTTLVDFTVVSGTLLGTSCCGKGLMMLEFSNVSRSEMHQKLLAREKELKEAHAELITNSRLNSLSLLAGGIAHEITNPMSIVLGKVRRLKRQLTQAPSGIDGRVEEDLNSIADVGKRIVKVVSSLSTIAHGMKKESFVRHVVAEVVEDSLRTAKVMVLTDGIQLQFKTELQGPDACFCDPVQLSQVIHSLLANAVEAISRDQNLSEHVICVGLRRNGERIEISVSNTGPKIPSEDRPRIFDPFFTTKSRHESMGLGLTMARKIVETHDGTLDLDTNADLTTFRISLPIA